MAYDEQKIEDVVLALLHLTSFTDREVTRAWKSHDWKVMTRLYEKGFISDPRSKNKSVVLTEEGVKMSKELFNRLFGKAV